MSQQPSLVESPRTVSKLDPSKELLVSYTTDSGDDQCAVVRVGDSYEEMLAEACRNLAPWLPQDWQNRGKYFVREIQNPRGGTVCAAMQPALVMELARLGRLSELRLRIHPFLDQEFHSVENNLRPPSEQSPAYEEYPHQSVVDGIVQVVLHRLYNEDTGHTRPPRLDTAPDTPTTQDTMEQSQDPNEALPAPGPQVDTQPQTISISSVDRERHAILPITGEASNTRSPLAPVLSQQAQNNQLPTPSSPSRRPTLMGIELPRQTSAAPRSLPSPPVTRLEKSTCHIERTLQWSAQLVSEGNHEAAIHSLRSASNGAIPPQERAQLFLWAGQISCEVMEYRNAGCDIVIARDIFAAVEDRAGRIECEIALARITRQRNGLNPSEDDVLTQLLIEAKHHGLEAIEVQLLCEICRLACYGKNVHEDLFLSLEQAKAGAQRLGDTWLMAESLRVTGTVAEAWGDYVSALEAYSSALELYRSIKAQSPLSPIRAVEGDIHRMRAGLSKSQQKPKSRFRKLF